jgi:phthalate 4,5-dioxygenase
MLSGEDNELLCRIGPGTPMGNLLRLYWIPALISSELPAADGPPIRVRLLGENLIAFRVTSGTVGLIQNHCPHRGASLFFGRNEEEGLRCVYHGWKYNVTGQCVDMPSEPEESNFKAKIRARAYPCVERNNIVWTYMGPREVPPPLPDIEPNLMATEEVVIQKALRECNWFQGLEGDIDTSHLGFLHLGTVKPENTKPGSFDYYLVKDRAPRYEVVDTEFGTSYGCYRPAEPQTYYWRVAHFLFPFYTMIPTGILGTRRFWCAPGCRLTTSTSCSGAWRCRARGRAEGRPVVRPRSKPAVRPRPVPVAWPAATASCPTRRTGSASSVSSRTWTTTI